MFRERRSRRGTPLKNIIFVFALAIIVGGFVAFLTQRQDYSQISWESKTDAAQIDVIAADSAFVSDVKMTTEKVEDQELLNLARRTAGQDSRDVLAFNITFTDKEGNESQPSSRVKVTIRPQDYDLSAERYALVHIDDNANAKYLGNIAASSNGELTFYADSFSIYAIIPTTQTDQQRYARYTYDFYVNDEIVATQTVRNGDILNAPAAPSLERLIFMGWYNENNHVFNGLNQMIEIPDGTTADKTIKLHARFADKIFSVVFFNPQGNVLATKTGTNGEEIDTDDIRHEVSAGHFVDGWTTDASILDRYVGCGNNCEIPDGEDIPNQINGNITINNSNVNLYPIIRSVKWVHYHQNDDDADAYTEASYNASDYAFYGHTVSAPNNPTRAGYSFVGWATDAQGTNMYDFNTPLTDDIDLYAIWRPNTDTRYRIVFWKEALVDGYYVEDSYEYAAHTDATGTSGNIVTVTQAQINNVLNQSDMTYYELDHAENGTVIHGDGSTVVNVYLKLKVYTVNFTVETDTGTGNNKYCFHYYQGSNERTSCQRNSYATTTNLVATYTDGNGNTHDLTKGYSFDARMGEIISDRYPGAGEITFSFSNVSNASPYAYKAKNNNPSNTTRVSKPVTMTEDLLLTNKTGGTTLILYGATSTSQVTVNYWFQNPNDNGYTRSNDYSFIANTNGSGNFNGRTLTGYGDPISNTPAGYDSSNAGNGIYHFYYDRMTYDLHFYNYNTPGNTHSNIRHGADLTLYDYIPERPSTLSSAYTFQGWYTTPDYIDGTEFDLTSEVMPMSDIMLYAKWENTNYVNVTFNPNGGEAIPSQRILYGNTAHVVDDPTRYGYSFVGWRKTDGSFFSFDNIILEDTELVASWVPYDTIYVHYDANGGEIFNQDDLSYVDTSTTAILPEPDEVPEGKYFVGWNVNGRIYYPGNIVMILLSDIPDGGDTMTIVAEWGKNVDKTSITYDPNTATGTATNYEQEQNIAFTVKDPSDLNFTKEGYTFTGWNSEPDGSGVTYRVGTQWAADNRATLPNVLYAQWEINCYSVVVYHLFEDGSTFDDTQTFEKCYGDTYETSASTDDSTYYGTVTSGEASGIITDHDVTVVYTYKKRDAVITVNHIGENGETLAPTDEVPGTFDEDYSVSASPELTPYYDYTSDVPLTGTVHGDITINITYTKKHFTLTIEHKYDADGSVYDTTQTEDKLYQDEYAATPSAKDNNYEVVRTEGSTSGTITGDTTVTFFYAKKTATMTVTHKMRDDGTVLNVETSSVEWGDAYNTSPLAEYITGYNYEISGDSASGTVSGDVNVTYAYYLKSFNVIVHHVVTDGETTTETSTILYGETCSVSPKAELLTAYNVEQSGDSCDEPATGDKDITFTYTRKQFTLTVHHQYANGDKFAEDSVSTHPYGYEYSTSPLTNDVDYVGTITSGAASGTLTDNTEITYTYNKIPYTLTVRHHDADGNTLKPDKIIDYESGDTYEAKPDAELAVGNNYSADIATTGIIRSNLVVTFTYQVKTYNVTVHHVVTDGENITETLTVSHGSACPAAPKSELLTAYNVVQSGDSCGDSVVSDLDITYTYNRKQFTLTINHQYEDGSEYDTTQTSTLAYGTHYDAAVSTKDENYEVVRTEGAASGDITSDTTVTFFYAKKEATLVVTHKDADGNTLAPTETSSIEWGNPYNTSPVASLLTNHDYTTEGSPASGTVSGDVTVNYIYTLKQYTFTVRHLDENGNPLANDDIETLTHGSTYVATPASSLAVLYNHTPETITGTITDNLTVSFTYVKKVATIVVHHVNTEGQTIAPDVSFTSPYGERYETEESAEIPSNYEFLRRTDNYTDTAMTPSIEVTYTYQKKDASLSSSVEIIDGADTLGNDSQSSAYRLSYTANVGNFLGDASVTIVNTLPYAIDPDNSELDGGIYDASNNTITWTETVSISDNPQVVSLNKILNLAFLDVPHTDRIAINSVEATIVLDTDKSRAATATESLNIAFYGNVKVHYYIEDSTNKLADDQEFSGLVGSDFMLEAREFDGYELMNPELAKIYSYTDDAQEIEFFYRLKELPPEPENPNTGEGLKVLPGIGAGAVFVAGLAFAIKRRRL